MMRKNRFGRIVIAALSALTVLTAAGCGKGYDRLLDPKSPVSITVWHYYNGVQQTQFDELVDEFNNTLGAEKGIFVEAYSQNSVGELAQNVIDAVNQEPGADAMPNIFGTYAETAYQVDQMGMLVDLSKYLSKDEMEEYVEDYLQEGSLGQEGALKIFPTAKSTEIMMINLTDWEKFAEECGVDYADLSTWEGLVRVSEKYYEYTDGLTSDVENDGKAFFGRDSVANYMVVGAKQLGNEFARLNADGSPEPAVDKETVRRLWENYYVPYVKGYFTAQSRFRSDDAKIGAILAMVCSNTGAMYFPTEVTIGDALPYPIENAVLPVPSFEGSEPYIVQQGAGMSVLKSDEKTEYACALFLKWITDTERNIRFSVDSGYLPVKKDANDLQTITDTVGEDALGGTVRNVFSVAIEEVNGSHLYTSPAFDRSAEMRDYIGNTMELTAAGAYEEAWRRIREDGEDRETVLAEYTDEAAFDAWYKDFEQGFFEIVGE